MLEELKGIKWGSFTPLHFATLALSAVIIAGLYLILRNKSEKTQQKVLFFVSLLAPAAVLYDLLYWGLQIDILQYLPLHLCSFNAVLLPVLVWKKSDFLGNLLPIYSVGAVAALVFNTFQADYTVFSHVFFMYYFSHTLEFGIPLLMLVLGLVKIKPKYIFPCLATTFVIYTGVHFINLAINDYMRAAQVNYMYSIAPMGNPALELFWSLIPYEYFYMLATIPVLAIAYTLLNLGNIIRACTKEKKHERNVI